MKRTSLIVGCAALALLAVVAASQMAAAQAMCPKVDQEGWIALFDGTSLDCWQNARKPEAENKWSIEDGVMTNADHGNDIGTKCAFKDFDLALEYKTVKDGNSGVYLRGRIEVQILDSYGKEPVDSHDNGGIYDKFAPKVNASKPAGEWNQLEATYKGDTLSVKLNGQVVIENQKIAELTGGALPGKVDEPGPLMLQGDHGKIWFRNIKVRPLDDQGVACAPASCPLAK